MAKIVSDYNSALAKVLALVDVEIASISPASEIARRCRDTWSTYPILKRGEIENFQSINIRSIFTANGKHTCDVLGII